jgi:hypothetical protein
MKRAYYLLLAMSTFSGAYWTIRRDTEFQLRARIATMRVEDGILARLRRDHTRLQASVNDAERQIASAPDSAGSSGSDSALPDAGPSMGIGTWAAPENWKPCGNATPDAAIESTFCAGAHGDLNSLKATLEFDDDALAKAESILAELPESSRRQYAGPKDLLSVIVAGSIPLESAQLVARQEDSPDKVTEYLRLKNSDGVTRQVCISLHQGPDGWRLSIPGSVTDKIRGQ